MVTLRLEFTVRVECRVDRETLIGLVLGLRFGFGSFLLQSTV